MSLYTSRQEHKLNKCLTLVKQVRERQYFFFASCFKKKAEFGVADRTELFEWRWNYLGEESIGIVLFCLYDIIINTRIWLRPKNLGTIYQDWGAI